MWVSNEHGMQIKDINYQDEYLLVDVGDSVRDVTKKILELFPKQDELAGGPGSLIRMPFGVHRLTGRRYAFYTPDGTPLAPTIREQICQLAAPGVVPEIAFESYRAFAPELVVTATEPPAADTETVSGRIKASMTVLELVSQYVDLKPTASGAVGLCPFHDDHHPSLGVNDEGNYWHCFAGCGGGSVIDFWMQWNFIRRARPG